MKKTALVYWPRRGSVEKNARRIADRLGHDHVHLIPLKDLDPDMLRDYPVILFGCSTVGADSWRNAWTGNQWFKFFVKMHDKNTDLTGKTAAIFGLGDQILYPADFVNEIAEIRKELKSRGATVIGNWPAEGYENTDSQALEGGHFMGLALDEHNQSELSEERISRWLEMLKQG